MKWFTRQKVAMIGAVVALLAIMVAILITVSTGKNKPKNAEQKPKISFMKKSVEKEESSISSSSSSVQSEPASTSSEEAPPAAADPAPAAPAEPEQQPAPAPAEPEPAQPQHATPEIVSVNSFGVSVPAGFTFLNDTTIQIIGANPEENLTLTQRGQFYLVGSSLGDTANMQLINRVIKNIVSWSNGNGWAKFDDVTYLNVEGLNSLFRSIGNRNGILH